MVAVPALPEIEPEIVWLKELEPEKVLLSASKVEEAAVVGHVERQVSEDRQRVAKVPLVEKRFVVVACVPVAFVKVRV